MQGYSPATETSLHVFVKSWPIRNLRGTGSCLSLKCGQYPRHGLCPFDRKYVRINITCTLSLANHLVLLLLAKIHGEHESQEKIADYARTHVRIYDDGLFDESTKSIGLHQTPTTQKPNPMTKAESDGDPGKKRVNAYTVSQ